MDPKFEFNAIARDIKIEMGRRYLTIPAQDKIQLFTSLYELDKEVMHGHLLHFCRHQDDEFGKLKVAVAVKVDFIDHIV